MTDPIRSALDQARNAAIVGDGLGTPPADLFWARLEAELKAAKQAELLRLAPSEVDSPKPDCIGKHNPKLTVCATCPDALFCRMSVSLAKTLELGLVLADGDREAAKAYARANSCAGPKVWRVVLERLGWNEPTTNGGT